MPPATYIAPLTAQFAPFERGPGRFQTGSLTQSLTLPASGFAGRPAAAGLAIVPRWTSATGPEASLPP